MTRRSFFQLAGVGSALLDAGEPLPAGGHVVSRTLVARGPVTGDAVGDTVLVAADDLVGPVIAGVTPFRATHLSVRVGERHARVGGAGVRVTRLG